jgi:hypothetical protein
VKEALKSGAELAVDKDRVGNILHAAGLKRDAAMWVLVAWGRLGSTVIMTGKSVLPWQDTEIKPIYIYGQLIGDGKKYIFSVSYSDEGVTHYYIVYVDGTILHEIEEDGATREKYVDCLPETIFDIAEGNVPADILYEQYLK